MVQVINNETLLLNTTEASVVTQVLNSLEANQRKVKNIRYGTTTLESMFIQLTSKDRNDV
jgi:ABC-2 type transport system ATP-binding protein